MAADSQRSYKIIGTHSGKFHADEALGCWMLKNHTEAYRNAQIIRSRKSEEWEKCDILIDVGGVYDVSTQRFDHHQVTFNDTFSANHETPLSSAGLVYKHYGKEIVQSIVQSFDEEKLSTEDLEYVYLEAYRLFVEGVDAIDNGVSQYVSSDPPKFVEMTNLAGRVSRLNPRWNEEATDEIRMQRFKEAMEICGADLTAILERIVKSDLPARAIVLKAFGERKKVHESGKIMELERFCPWKSHYFALGDEEVLYVLFPGDDSYRVICVPIFQSSFESRKKLKQEWGGYSDEELEKLSGIPGMVFVHKNAWIGGNKTREGALQMAIQSLDA